jgi:MYXO-CTERM domain-containing protein
MGVFKKGGNAGGIPMAARVGRDAVGCRVQEGGSQRGIVGLAAMLVLLVAACGTQGGGSSDGGPVTLRLGYFPI